MGDGCNKLARRCFLDSEKRHAGMLHCEASERCWSTPQPVWRKQDVQMENRQCSQVENGHQRVHPHQQRPTAIKKGKTMIFAESALGFLDEVRLVANGAERN